MKSNTKFKPFYTLVFILAIQLTFNIRPIMARQRTKCICKPTTPTADPTVQFSYTPSSTNSLEINFDGSTSSDPDGTLVSYRWDFGDSASGTGETTTHTYAGSGTYKVTLTVTDNQNRQAQQVQTITVTKTPSFTYGISGLTLTFNADTSDASIQTYQWTFGDGNTATGATATNTYAAADTYTVTLTVTYAQGTTATATQTFTLSIFSAGDVQQVGNVVQFSAADIVGSSSPSSSNSPSLRMLADTSTPTYTWDFGDGTTGTGESVAHVYQAVGTYTVTVTVPNPDGTTVVAGQTVDITDILNSGPLQFTVLWSRPSGGDVHVTTPNGNTIWSENPGPGSSTDYGTVESIDGGLNVYWTEANPPPTGSYYFCFEANNFPDLSLSDPVVVTVVVQGVTPQPISFNKAFTYNYIPENLCSPVDYWDYMGTVQYPPAGPVSSFTYSLDYDELLVNFDASISYDPTGTIVSYTWDFGDIPSGTSNTATGITASHVYPATGVYSVTLTVTNDQGATATTTQSIDIYDSLPYAYFDYTSGTTVVFDASSSNDLDGNIVEYVWDFGDSTTNITVTQPIVDHSYATAGVYQVTLKVIDIQGGSSTYTDTVNAPSLQNSAVIHADGFFNVKYFAAEDPDNSEDGDDIPPVGIAAYAWDFGDPASGDSNTAFTRTQTHQYAADGVYHVTLTVTDAEGSTATIATDVRVSTVVPQPPFDYNPTGNNPLTLRFDGTLQYGDNQVYNYITNYYWNFGDSASGASNTASGAVVDHTFSTSGAYNVTCTFVDNRGGSAVGWRVVNPDDTSTDGDNGA